MELDFIKMHALGNDFIVLNATKSHFSLTEKQIQKLSDRNSGIGCDQVLILEKINLAYNQFFYRIYNADGKEVFQCGNGARCMAKYIFENALSSSKIINLYTKFAFYEATVYETDIVINMGKPEFNPQNIPYKSSREYPLLNEKMNAEDFLSFGVCSFGNPHAIFEVDDLKKHSISDYGSQLNNHVLFPEGVNVSFMQIINPGKIKLLTYERGVGRTWACGSGACAAMVIGRLRKLLSKNVVAEMPRGKLKIMWQDEQMDVFLQGEAHSVFEGKLTNGFMRNLI